MEPSSADEEYDGGDSTGREPLLSLKSNESRECKEDADEEGGESRPERMKEG
jgi:hypothetical protein